MNRVFIRGQGILASILVLMLVLSPLQTLAQEAETPTSSPSIETPTDSSTTSSPDTSTETIPPTESASELSLPEEFSSPSSEEEIPIEEIPPPMSLFSSSDPAPLPESLTQFTYQTSPSKVDQVSGALTQRLPLVVPPGRNGLDPDLALQYNSQRAEDDIVGYGWNISIPYIERVNKKGSERLYTDNYFTSSLGGDLATTSLATSTPVEYRHKVEDGSFLKYAYSNNAWVAYDKNGTKYTFGTTTQARQFDVASSTQIYRWMIEEIRDTNNNFIRFEYTKDSNQIYPYKIYYTGYNSTDGIFLVEFTKSARPDAYVSYKAGFEVETAYRITEVKTSVNGQWVRKYTLSYTSGNNGNRSLLQSVQETGRDENAVELPLPAITFEYASSTSLFYEPSEDQTLYTSALVVGDRNGDALNDITISYIGHSPVVPWYRFWTNTGTNGSFSETFEEDTTLVPETWATENGVGRYLAADSRTKLIDINADGKNDLIVSSSHGSSAPIQSFYINTYAP